MEISAREIRKQKLIELYENTVGNLLLKELDTVGLQQELDEVRKANKPLLQEAEKNVDKLEQELKEIEENEELPKAKKKKLQREPLEKLENLRRMIPQLQSAVVAVEKNMQKNKEGKEALQRVAKQIEIELTEYNDLVVHGVNK